MNPILKADVTVLLEKWLTVLEDLPLRSDLSFTLFFFNYYFNSTGKKKKKNNDLLGWLTLLKNEYLLKIASKCKQLHKWCNYQC